MPRQYTPRVPRVCEQCGATFMVMPCVLRQRSPKYCGKACESAARRTPDGPERTCSRCGESKPIEQFQKRGEYRLTFCNACAAVARREKYANDPDFAEAMKRAASDYRQANPEHIAAKKREDYWKYRERNLARATVGHAVRTGRLVRHSCWCGDPDTEAHHHRGYDESHRLDVVWLCRVHHGLAHRKDSQ